MTHSKYQGLKKNSSKILLAFDPPIGFLLQLTWMLRGGEKQPPPGTYIIAFFRELRTFNSILCDRSSGGFGLAAVHMAH